MSQNKKSRIRNARRVRVALVIGAVSVIAGIPMALGLAQSGFIWGPTHEDQQVANLRAELATTTDMTARADIEGKLNVLLRDRASELSARSQVPNGNSPSDAKSKQLAQDRASEIVTAEAGVPVTGIAAGNGTISSNPISSLPGSIFVDTNAWFGPMGANTTRIVLAGTDGNGGKGLPTPAQGELFVSDAPSSTGTGRSQVSRGTFKPAGPAHGALRVSGASGDILTLQATDGTLYYFDAANLAFVPTP